MKKIFQLLALGLLITIFVGCSKDDDDSNDDGKNPSDVISAVIDGDSFKASEIEGYYYDGDIEIYGYNNTIEADIYITAEIDEPGTYDLSEAYDDGTIYIDFDSDDDEIEIEMVTGELIITKLTETRIEATFSGQGYDYVTEELLPITKGIIKARLEEDE
ncbi:MAG TPA: DUF6252 family protein [Ohtaekwangia sp.]|nr:DUF6252 family protein [Ohtaekwangia sp.]